ncbi:MAG: hypothetical protein ACLQJR_29465 [Stellaceae bacterium]
MGRRSCHVDVLLGARIASNFERRRVAEVKAFSLNLAAHPIAATAKVAAGGAAAKTLHDSGHDPWTIVAVVDGLVLIQQARRCANSVERSRRSCWTVAVRTKLPAASASPAT